MPVFLAQDFKNTNYFMINPSFIPIFTYYYQNISCIFIKKINKNFTKNFSLSTFKRRMEEVGGFPSSSVREWEAPFLSDKIKV